MLQDGIDPRLLISNLTQIPSWVANQLSAGDGGAGGGVRRWGGLGLGLRGCDACAGGLRLGGRPADLPFTRRELVTARREKLEGTLVDFLTQVENDAKILRVPGTAVFLHPNSRTTPLALRENVQFNHILHDEVIVVSDGSEDRTVEIARSFEGVRTVALKENHGKGFAMAVGVANASNDTLFFCDGDMYNVTDEHIAALILPVLSGESDMNIGVRDRGAVDGGDPARGDELVGEGVDAEEQGAHRRCVDAVTADRREERQARAIEVAEDDGGPADPA